MHVALLSSLVLVLAFSCMLSSMLKSNQRNSPASPHAACYLGIPVACIASQAELLRRSSLLCMA